MKHMADKQVEPLLAKLQAGASGYDLVIPSDYTVAIMVQQGMLEALDKLFEHEHPGVHFALTLRGTRTAPAALAAGRSRAGSTSIRTSLPICSQMSFASSPIVMSASFPRLISWPSTPPPRGTSSTTSV